MRFLFFTDCHLKTRTPVRRSGSYEDDIFSKLVFLMVTAQQKEVDFIVCGGDLFDRPTPSFRLASKVMSVITSTNIPWYHVLGNHEIIGHNPDSYDMGILAFYEHLPIFRIAQDISIPNRADLKFIHYRHGIEEIKDAWHCDSNRGIIFAHAMVTPTPVPFTHVTPQQLKDYTNARLVLLGHYHDPWANIVVRGKLDDKTKKEFAEAIGSIFSAREKEWTLEIPLELFDQVTLFLNPGSIARISLLAHNLKRTPRAFVVDMSEESLAITAIPILTAKASDDVFKMEEALIEKRWEHSVKEFLDAMEDVKVEGIEASTLITNAAKIRAGVDSIDDLNDEQSAVLDYALNVIGKLEKAEAER